MTTLQNICNIIILFGAVAGAITGILALIGKPVGFLKRRKEKVDQEHRKEMVQDVSTLVNKEIIPKLDEIHQQNLEQNEDIQNLTHTMRNSLGAEIMAFYESHKYRREITEIEKDALEDLYKSYKAVKGNHYVDKIYDRMTLWTVIAEDGTKLHNVCWWKPSKNN